MLKSALDTIVDEMAGTVMRTARSPIVRDVLDYSATLCDRNGLILSQAKTVALHLGAVPDAMDVIVARFGDSVRPGDVFILNDPYAGGMHLPDIFMIKPIFAEERLQGYAVVVAHHCDMGGRVPGSNAADSTEIYQEGLRIPPSRLYTAGEPNTTLYEIIKTNVRVPDLVMGDLDAQLAACTIGERELRRLVARHGEAELHRYFDALLDYGEDLTRAGIAAWPDGTYRFTDPSTATASPTEPIPICCAIIVDGDSLVVDFEGSSPQVRGAINATFSFTKSSAYLSIRCALSQDVPNNAGVYRAITVKAPKHSILNPDMPAPVAARALTGYRVVDAVLGALAQIAPDKIMAAGEGGNTVIAIGGYDRATGEPFILVDMINGAWGGRSNKDGVEGITNPAQNMSNLPIETLEARYPLRMEEYALQARFLRRGRVPRRRRPGPAISDSCGRHDPAGPRRPHRDPALWSVWRRAGHGVAQHPQSRGRRRGPAGQVHPGRRPRHRDPSRAGGRRRLWRSAETGYRGNRRRSAQREDQPRLTPPRGMAWCLPMTA